MDTSTAVAHILCRRSVSHALRHRCPARARAHTVRRDTRARVPCATSLSGDPFAEGAGDVVHRPLPPPATERRPPNRTGHARALSPGGDARDTNAAAREW